MAGAIVQVIPTRTIIFGNMSSDNDLELVLKSGIDVTEWQTAALIVKVQPLTTCTGGNFFDVNAYLEGPTPEDPGAFFVSKTPVASARFEDVANQSFSVAIPLGPGLGSTLRVTFRGHVVLSNSGIASISIDACLRNF